MHLSNAYHQMDAGHSLFMMVALCLDTSLTFFLLVHIHLIAVEVFRSSTALTTLKFPHNFNNLFASNKARLLKPIFHTWLSFFFWRPIDIESQPFSFDLTSSHDRNSVNFGYTAYYTRIKTADSSAQEGWNLATFSISALGKPTSLWGEEEPC